MKLEFDGHQEYQLEAIQAVIDVFEGQPLAKSSFESVLKSEVSSLAFSDNGIANQLILSHESILTNIKTIQERNGLTISDKIEKSGDIDFNFTIEMEIGTGKTYTYLRTIYELNKQYGFLKFVIVVPSIAIREGVIKNLQITQEHFQKIYNNIPVNPVLYDSKNYSALRNFATSNAIQILVINIDSFAKDSNVINTMRETGIKPIEYIQHSRPIVIIDEPQNMETELRKAAIANLKPLCTLRYSATHKDFYNLLYSLNPVQAYDKGLVKQIEVDGITSNNNSAAFIAFKKLMQGKRKLQAKVSIYVNDNNGVNIKELTLDIGNDLFQKSNHRDAYKEGFILNSINAELGTIEFSGGLLLQIGEAQGGLNNEVLKFQIERTVESHFEKVAKLKPLDIKVLSLFFIDKVANYKDYSIDGEAQQGKFAHWFEAAFIKTAQKKQYQGLIHFAVNDVHNGYFSCEKKTVGKIKKEQYLIPDVYAYIQNRVNVSRNTVYEVLKQSGRLDELAINPQLFLDKVVLAIRNTLNELLVNGIQYHKVNNSFYEMSLFHHEELETYLDNLLAVSNDKRGKTLFNYYAVDSDIERQFARDCEADESVKFFFKLPRGFKIPTPIGYYIPDWAIVFENDKRIYFVTETKSTLNTQERRISENMKIIYAEKLFDSNVEEPVFYSDVIYKTVVKVSDLY